MMPWAQALGLAELSTRSSHVIFVIFLQPLLGQLPSSPFLSRPSPTGASTHSHLRCKKIMLTFVKWQKLKGITHAQKNNLMTQKPASSSLVVLPGSSFPASSLEKYFLYFLWATKEIKLFLLFYLGSIQPLSFILQLLSITALFCSH